MTVTSLSFINGMRHPDVYDLSADEWRDDMRFCSTGHNGTTNLYEIVETLEAGAAGFQEEGVAGVASSSSSNSSSSSSSSSSFASLPQVSLLSMEKAGAIVAIDNTLVAHGTRRSDISFPSYYSGTAMGFMKFPECILGDEMLARHTAGLVTGFTGSDFVAFDSYERTELLRVPIGGHQYVHSPSLCPLPICRPLTLHRLQATICPCPHGGRLLLRRARHEGRTPQEEECADLAPHEYLHRGNNVGRAF